MFKRILIALDGRPGSNTLSSRPWPWRVLQALRSPPYRWQKSCRPMPPPSARWRTLSTRSKHSLPEIQAQAVGRASAEGVEMETAVRAGDAARAILQFASEGGHDLIVIGADGHRGLGGTADKVAENAPCSVLIVRLLPFWLESRT